MLTPRKKFSLPHRFRGLLPVVIDVETTGLDPQKNGLLELAAITIDMDAKGKIFKDKRFAYHIEPFIGAELDPAALAITGIDPDYPLRFAVPEAHALHLFFQQIQAELILKKCQRAVLVGHNAWFDLAFLHAAAKRCHLQMPFHSFTSFDTATMSALAIGETVLARAAKCVGVAFDVTQAHSAIYDTECTADLFCFIVNHSVCS